MGTRKSIILVTVDCLRVDHVGFMGYGRPTTPFLDSLANESFIFPTAIVAGVPTYYSFPAIFGSRYPMSLGRDVLGLAPSEPTLATALKQAGYATAAFSAANPYLSSRFGYAQGFDAFSDFLQDEIAALTNTADPASGMGWTSRLNRRIQKIRPSLGPLGFIYDELYFDYCQRVTPAAKSLDELRRFPAADVIVDHAGTWLGGVGNQPFFLWLHLMDPHAPYYPKQEAVALMEQEALTPQRARYLNSYWNRSDIGPRRLARHREEVVALYDAGIRWVDLQMARLVEMLRRGNLWDDCVFAFTADHGEEFLEHGGRYHPPSHLPEELIHVPLLLRVPRARKMEMAKTPFSLVHLAPTLLDAVDQPGAKEFQGRSQWRQICDGISVDGVAVSECVATCANPFRSADRMGPRVLSVRESRFKLVLHFGPVAEQLYDLEADPAERAPLASNVQKAVRRRLLEVAREHLCQSTQNRDSRARVQTRLGDLRLEWKKPAHKSSKSAS